MRCVSFCGNLFLFKKFRRGVYLSADKMLSHHFIATTYLMLQHSKTQDLRETLYKGTMQFTLQLFIHM